MTAAALKTIARRLLETEANVRGATLLAAVSGGPDSMAMLDVLATLAAPLGFTLHAHGVDHGLRPEAPAELALAQAHAADRAVPFATTRVEVARGGNLQARAREARRAALREAAVAVGARFIATAHHADDRAETFLMRLLRGSGPKGLAVLPPVAPLEGSGGAIELLRPLLRARRADVLAHCLRRKIPYASDPSNADPTYLRVRVRTELMPVLAALGPGVVDHISGLCDQLEAVSAGGPALPLPRATQEALVALLRSRSKSARLSLPGGVVLRMDDVGDKST